jgi:hypothetical protein
LEQWPGNWLEPPSLTRSLEAAIVDGARTIRRTRLPRLLIGLLVSVYIVGVGVVLSPAASHTTAGIDLAALSAQLQSDGAKSFIKS